MLLAEYRRLTALNVELWRFPTGVIYATPANDINRAILSMLLAERPRLAALNIELWCCPTGVM